MSPAASSRWCPTPEQLMILEEMYRSGIRTPNAVQIQQIAAHLAFYGRIEGKNVFYWFQNHKARDRQKLRKKLTKQLHQQQQHQQMYHHPHHHHVCSLDHSKLPFPHASNYYYPSTSFLPQGEGKEEITNNTAWKNDVSVEKMEIMESPIMEPTYGRDWTMMMMMMDVSTPSPKPPLKTLELFPITSSSKNP